MTDPALTEAAFAAAVEQAQAAAKSYYDTGDVLMTDADYDALLDRIAAAKKAHPEWDDGGLTTRAAAGVPGGPAAGFAWGGAGGVDVGPRVPIMPLGNHSGEPEVRAFVASLDGDPCLV